MRGIRRAQRSLRARGELLAIVYLRRRWTRVRFPPFFFVPCIVFRTPSERLGFLGVVGDDSFFSHVSLNSCEYVSRIRASRHGVCVGLSP